MELWEFNICVQEYNEMQSEKSKNDTTNAWQTANFTGAAFCGKLKKLDDYLKQSVSKAPQISKNEFEEKLAEAERRAKN
ncbi:MAG: hypothetical protein K2G63_03395 [Oscillospiraceae bacterium]|nr:hypothetical protein [Oscillospiraceae bacterium]